MPLIAILLAPLIMAQTQQGQQYSGQFPSPNSNPFPAQIPQQQPQQQIPNQPTQQQQPSQPPLANYQPPTGNQQQQLPSQFHEAQPQPQIPPGYAYLMNETNVMQCLHGVLSTAIHITNSSHVSKSFESTALNTMDKCIIK